MNRFIKMIAWLLVCSVLFLTFEIVPALAEDPFDILTKLSESISQNPTEGRMLDDTESVNDYCKILYDYLDKDIVESVFYNGLDGATKLMKQLSGIIHETDLYADVTLADAETFYVCVWAIIHSDLSQSSKSRPAIKEIILRGGSSDDIKRMAIQEGMKTLRMSALTKVAQGLTTLDEAVTNSAADKM